MQDESTSAPEPAADPSPPAPPLEIARYVTALSPENVAKAKAATPDDPLTEWRDAIERMGLEDAVGEIEFPCSPQHGLAIVLLNMPRDERHEISRKHTWDITCLTGLVWEWLDEDGDQDASGVVPELLAPEIMAAFNWMVENQPATLMKSAGLGNQLN